MKIKQDFSVKKEKQLKADQKGKGYMNKEAGIGEAFVQAVNTGVEETKNLTDSFLGVPKQTIEVKQFAHTLDKKK